MDDPTNKKEVQSFLGFTNFYQRFIEGFSHVAHPLFNLTKVDPVFHWSTEEQFVRGHLLKLIPITKSDDPGPTSAPTFYIPPHRR